MTPESTTTNCSIPTTVFSGGLAFLSSTPKPSRCAAESMPTAPIGWRDVKPTPTGMIIVQFLNGKIPLLARTGLNFVDVRSAALGHLGNADHPEVRAAIADAGRRIRKAGKAAGILAPLEADARHWLAQGYTVVAVGSDLNLLARGSEALASKFKNSP